MRPYVSVLIFLTFLISSVLSSIDSYRNTEFKIRTDLNQALAQTLEAKRDLSITPDTIRTYRNHLNITELKDRAYVSYCLRDEQSDVTCSDTIVWRAASGSIGFRGYANCSFGTIFSMSDQRLSLALSFMAMAWMALSVLYFRKHNCDEMGDFSTYGELCYSASDNCFYNARRDQIHLTPMQAQLMQMFFTSDNHQLTKSEICDSLWPKKEDASETLYTLIRRIKPIIEDNSNLKIEVNRGRAYRLTIK